jgi:hypothetical protein
MLHRHHWWRPQSSFSRSGNGTMVVRLRGPMVSERFNRVNSVPVSSLSGPQRHLQTLV